MKHPPRQKTIRNTPATLRWLGLLAAAVLVTSCSNQHSAEAADCDIVTDSGYSVHVHIEISKTDLEPLGYELTIKNTGRKPIMFKPTPPDCTLLLDPGVFTPNALFNTESDTTDLAAEKRGSVTLVPGNSMPIPLPILDQDSPLRGRTHECQVVIRRILTDTERADKKVFLGAPLEIMRSKSFRIMVP